MSRDFVFDCPLPNGLHARPATALAAFCESFESEVHCTNLRNGSQATMGSVLAMISADIRHGDSVECQVSGADADQAATKLQTFIEDELAATDEDPVSDKGEDPGRELGNEPIPRSLADLEPDAGIGVGLVDGIGRGQAVVLEAAEFSQDLIEQAGQGSAEEWAFLSSAINTAASGLHEQQAKATGAERAVLEAQQAILGDRAFSDALKDALADGETPRSAAYALAAVTDHFAEQFGATGNPYLQERALDIRDICLQLMTHVYGDQAGAALPQLTRPSVVITRQLLPTDFVRLNGPFLAGLVLEDGGRTSHTVLLARGAGVPTIGGLAAAESLAQRAESGVVVDGAAGWLVAEDNGRVSAWFDREMNHRNTLEQQFAAFADCQGKTRDGLRVEVAANIATEQEAGTAFSMGCEGIGLFRTEMLFGEQEPPTESGQADIYRTVLEAAEGKPVIIRTFDIGGDKPVPWLQQEEEDNPFLGVRGARLYPHHEEHFRTQLRALLQAAPAGDLRIMLPMISTVEELRWARAVYAEEFETQQAQTPSLEAPPLGIMIEVPSAALMVTELAEHSDFFSIGSNDLAQYFFACDRGNQRLSGLASGFQPGFLRFLKETVHRARQADKWIGICGDLASDELAWPLLTGMGFSEWSMAAPQALRCKSVLSAVDSGDCRALLDQALQCDDAEAVQTMARDFLASSGGTGLFDEKLVTFRESAGNKAEVIKDLVDLAFLAGRTRRAAALENAVWAREEVFSTGLGFGIAIPHCKSDAVDHNSLCIARYEKPLDWASRDGEPVDTVIMLLVREAEGGDAHMKIFAQIARRIMHEEFRAELRACQDANALLEFLQAAIQD